VDTLYYKEEQTQERSDARKEIGLEIRVNVEKTCLLRSIPLEAGQNRNITKFRYE
jgi:hypothetical protein